MKTDIHPTWHEAAKVVCACGNSWTTGSTMAEIRTDICSNCHPFYTGEQRIVDTEGQVERFMKRLEARDTIVADKETAEAERTSPDLSLAELELSSRTVNVLDEAKVKTAGDFIGKLEKGGDQALLDIKGFGRKGLADVKRELKKRGFEIPED